MYYRSVGQLIGGEAGIREVIRAEEEGVREIGIGRLLMLMEVGALLTNEQAAMDKITIHHKT